MKAAFLLSLLLVTKGVAAESSAPLEFARLDLLDGRKLTDVVIKTYDAKTQKVLLIASDRAMTIPIAVIPPPFSTQLKTAAPASGANLSTLPAPAVPVAPVGAASAPIQQPIAVAQPKPLVRSSNMAIGLPSPTSAATDQANAFYERKQHQAAARDRAEMYFRFEHQMGSNNVTVTDLKIECSPAEPVEGWVGRFRTTGTAYIQYYDSKGNAYQRTKSDFEVLTEQKPKGPITVESFTRKS